MKKFLAILVATVMILSSISVFAAEAMDKPVASYSYEAETLTVSGSADANGEVTVYVVNPGKTKNDVGTEGALQNFRKISVDAEGKYTYKFKFSNPIEGTYTIYVDASGKEAASTTFKYAGETSKTNIISALYGEDDSNAIKTVLSNADYVEYLQVSEFAPFAEADIDGLSTLLAGVLSGKAASGDNNKDITELTKVIRTATVTQLFNEGKTSFVVSGTTILYDEDMGVNSLNQENKTLYTAYKDVLSASAKANVLSAITGKNFATSDELLKAFAENVVLEGIANPKDLGYGHVTKILTAANCAYVGMTYNAINNAQVTKIAALAKQTSITELSAKIKAILDDPANSQISAGGGSTGGGGGAGGGATVVTPSDNSYLGNGNGSLPTVAAPKGTTYFSDVKDYEWADEAIGYLYKEGIVSGTSENTFAPSANLTREQFAKVLCILKGIEVKENDKFDDVESGAWYAPYIGALSDAGLVSGIVEGTFGVGYNITREDLCVMIYRAFSDKIKAEKTKTFTDSASINSYATDAVNALAGAGILNGFADGSFRPQANCTRAEMAKIVYEIAQIIK